MRIKIKKGLDIPLSGGPDQVMTVAGGSKTVALLGTDTPGLKPQMAVA